MTVVCLSFTCLRLSPSVLITNTVRNTDIKGGGALNGKKKKNKTCRKKDSWSGRVNFTQSEKPKLDKTTWMMRRSASTKVSEII